MTTNLILAIAALCFAPDNLLNSMQPGNEVYFKKCQKYYASCMLKKEWPRKNTDFSDWDKSLLECMKDRK